MSEFAVTLQRPTGARAFGMTGASFPYHFVPGGYACSDVSPYMRRGMQHPEANLACVQWNQSQLANQIAGVATIDPNSITAQMHMQSIGHAIDNNLHDRDIAQAAVDVEIFHLQQIAASGDYGMEVNDGDRAAKKAEIAEQLAAARDKKQSLNTVDTPSDWTTAANEALASATTTAAKRAADRAETEAIFAVTPQRVPDKDSPNYGAPGTVKPGNDGVNYMGVGLVIVAAAGLGYFFFFT